MWFQMPEGCGGISVELQHFGPEVEDKAGRKYFRAPNHFAPKILMLKGFSAAEPPEGAPDDLPQPDPARDGAIAELTATHESMKMEIANLRTDLGTATARISALVTEKDTAQALIKKLEEKIEELEEDDDVPAPKPAVAPAVVKK